MDHGSHSFYLTFAWLGSLPTHVTAKNPDLDRQWNTEDNLNCVLTFPNGFAHTFLTWTAGCARSSNAAGNGRAAGDRRRRLGVTSNGKTRRA